jgi:hypothetical protein
MFSEDCRFPGVKLEDVKTYLKAVAVLVSIVQGGFFKAILLFLIQKIYENL